MIIHRVFFGLTFHGSNQLSTMFRTVIALFICLTLPAPLFASEDNITITVDYSGHSYSTTISARAHTSPDALFTLLTSYDQLNTFSRVIEKSELLANGDLLLELNACFLFLCFEKKQTLAIAISDLSIKGVIVPEGSDFKSGHVHWLVTPNGEYSDIQFSSEMTPDFWIPPFIGPLLIKHKLKSEAEYSIRLLEELAKPTHSGQ